MASVDNLPAFHFSALLDTYHTCVENAMCDMQDQGILARLWNRDQTIWQPAPTDIDNRLGWLQCVETMRSELAHIRQFAHDVHREGYHHVLLLGMGGSSLAPAVFAQLFNAVESPLQLTVLDSTNPHTISAYTHMLDPTRTLFTIEQIRHDGRDLVVVQTFL